MLKQIVASIVVLVIAFAGWVFFVPGANETLARYGINLPIGGAADAATPGGDGAQANRPQGGPNQGGPGGGGQRFGGASRTPTVILGEVGEGLINDRLTAIGEGTAIRSATVTAPSAGQLLELSVAPGDVIEAGAVIARLDSDTEQIDFDRARLAADDAEATLARTTELANSASATAVQLKTAQLAADTARLEMRNVELALERRTITAPITGTVGLIQVNIGNYVPAQTAVTTIDDTSEILVNFWVPERYASALTLGMPVTATAVALPGQTFDGTISAIDNRIDPQSRTLQVQARIPNEAGLIRAGMSFSVTMAFPGDTFAVVDPLSIQWSNEGAYVWKYVDGKVERAAVTIVQRNSDGVLVSGEVAKGDEVVTQGVLQLTPGAEVRLLDDGNGERAAEGNGQGNPG